MRFLESDLIVTNDCKSAMSDNKHCFSWLITLVQVDKEIQVSEHNIDYLDYLFSDYGFYYFPVLVLKKSSL